MDSQGSDELVVSGGRAIALLDEATRSGARRIVEDGTAPNTARAYAADMDYVRAWAEVRGHQSALPYSAAMILQFVVDHVEGMEDWMVTELVLRGAKSGRGRHAISTVRRRLVTVSVAHKMAGLENPCADSQVKEFLRQAGRAVARRGWTPEKKAAAPLDVLDKMVATCREFSTLIDVRDEALLLFGWASGGRRRSEIAGATMDRLEQRGDDFVYLLGISKTHQDGDSGYVPVAGRAADAMRKWLDVSGISTGPIFRGVGRWGEISESALNDRAVARIVKARAKRAGYDPDRFAGHSLRSGFLTQAGLANINLAEAMEMSMHSDLKTAAGYYQAGAALNNKGARLAG